MRLITIKISEDFHARLKSWAKSTPYGSITAVTRNLWDKAMRRSERKLSKTNND